VKAPENAVTAPPAVAPAPESPASFAPPVVTAPAAAEGGAVRIALTAEEETWISATSNGKSVYVGTLQPKETKEIAAADSIKLVIGNAGGLEITLNGKSIPPVGPKGQVRVVQLTREGVQVIPRTSPPAQPL
jgi:cytoskeleton protein RodZ